MEKVQGPNEHLGEGESGCGSRSELPAQEEETQKKEVYVAAGEQMSASSVG